MTKAKAAPAPRGGSKVTPAEHEKLMLADLARSGLTAADARKMQMFPAIDADGNLGYIIPYMHADGKPSSFYRLRYLEDVHNKKTGKLQRYAQPEGSKNQIYLSTLRDWPAIFAGDAPLLVTEGEKKAAKGCKEGITTIGTGGVDSWQQDGALLPIFAEMNLKNRVVYICYDSDAVTNPHVLRAEIKFADALRVLGARVFICRLPPAEDGSKVGLDDYLIAHSIEEFGTEVIAKAVEGIALDNFYVIHPASKALYEPSGQYWTQQSVNAALPSVLVGQDNAGKPIYQQPYLWLAKNRGCETECYDPALPQINKHMVAQKAGYLNKANAVMFNKYTPPSIELGDAHEGELWWGGHVHKLFPNKSEADHIIKWCAHRVQKPGQKVRHALVIGGAQGTGKDTIFETMLPALGVWNCGSIPPDKIFSQFNEHAAKVFVRINEVADLHDASRWKFYEATKNLISGVPDYIGVNQKYGVEYYARNCTGIVMTTNHPETGLYLPPEDRRHFVVETIPLWEGSAEYFRQLWNWVLKCNGHSHIAAYLHSVDISSFDPDAPPPKTATFANIVAHSMSVDTWLLDALEKLGDPDLVRLDEIRTQCSDIAKEQFSKIVGHAMSRAGYTLLRNLASKDGRHNLLDASGKRKQIVVYIKKGRPVTKAALAKIERPNIKGAKL
jgi:hypothetical protein